MSETTRRIQLAIVDYGLGNQNSLQSSCRKLGHRAVISNNPEVLNKADVLLLPGVELSQRPWQIFIVLGWSITFTKHPQRRGIIGICLGMQLLTEQSTD